MLEPLEALPYYRLVPKEYHANLAFRSKVLELGDSDPEYAAALWDMCRTDVLFYVNTFVWTFDPRRPDSKKVPFISYDYQDKALLFLKAGPALRQDRLIEKSRDMGASWLCLIDFEHSWHFEDMFSGLLVSRTEDLVDKTEDPKSLFWKIDFIHQHLPAWLLPKMNRTHLHLVNFETGGTIDGESTTGDVARGDRRTKILLDEFASVPDGYKILASTRDATNCRIFNSTPRGVGNAFYEVRQKGDIPILRMHWSAHPEKALGLYTDGEGKMRSPWYDEQCKRAVHPMEIKQELDIDFLGSDYQFFDPKSLDEIQEKYCRPPYLQGELELGAEGRVSTFEARDRGRLKLWMYIDPEHRPPQGRQYVLGIDVATGTGASNSVISAVDRRTKEKVAEFVTPNLLPHELARMAIAMGHWLCDGDARPALMIWESNGPGRIFGKTVLDSGYGHIYYKRDERSVSAKVTDIPGWFTSAETKTLLLGEYRRAMKELLFVNRSVEAVSECRQYVYLSNGSIAHARAANTVDPSGAADNHGDRVIADALCWMGVKEMALPASEELEIPQGSFAWRRNKAQERHALQVSAAW